MLVADVMTSPAVSIRRGAPLEEAIQLLGAARISALPVVDAELRVVGIVSEADILREPLPRDPRAHLWPPEAIVRRDLTVDDVMTDDTVCVTAHTDCSDVALALADTGWKSMPVVEDGHLVGMVSRSDILRSLAVPDEITTQAVLGAFAAAGHPEWVAVVRSGHVTVDPPVTDLGEAALATASTVPGVRSVQLGSPAEDPDHEAGPER
ncbi:CBS domain-containing protein [Pedococcus bigeumensis]|uniref:CBS domain-containing protein n=1 Tax=Pedococcus bigeumensis TaxID=433644 RepID=A0A502CYP7_9MICO|nr:CBS domain-containing protein [Pedococcus bigeumensis]TPG17953.1 CBS domain-containing protein [Pedococcus bigeumensis]